MVSLKEMRADPRKRALLGLLPMTIVVIWLMIRALTDKSGPYHGKIRLALAVMALASLVLMFFGHLRAMRSQPKG